MRIAEWLSTRDARTLLLGLGSMTLIIAVGRVAPALHATFTRAVAESSLRRQVLERDRWLAASESSLRASAADMVVQLQSLERSAFPGATPAESAASLAMLLETFARRAKVQIGSTNSQADTSFTSDFQRISVRVFATADAQGVLELLAMIESSDRLLAVRELTLSQPDPAAEDAVPESLRLEFVVEALARRGTVVVEPAT